MELIKIIQEKKDVYLQPEAIAPKTALLSVVLESRAPLNTMARSIICDHAYMLLVPDPAEQINGKLG